VVTNTVQCPLAHGAAPSANPVSADTKVTETGWKPAGTRPAVFGGGVKVGELALATGVGALATADGEVLATADGGDETAGVAGDVPVARGDCDEQAATTNATATKPTAASGRARRMPSMRS
jgi:hypothetical protein